MPNQNNRKTTTNLLEEAVNRLTQGQNTLHRIMSICPILEHFAPITTTPTSPKSPQTPNPIWQSRPHIKLEVPRFDGQDPMGWIFKISQFFDYQGVPNHERLIVGLFYMEGPTLCWYQWMSRNGFLTLWSTMLQALESCFAPSFYENPQGALFKLQQCSTVKDYLTEFERLANQIVSLAPPFLLSCFVSDLNPDLLWEVQALQSLFSAPSGCLGQTPGRQAQWSMQQSLLRHTVPSLILPTTKHSGTLQHLCFKLPFKRLSLEEMVVRWDKGPCYHCDEKWILDHRCKLCLHLLIANEDDYSPYHGYSSNPFMPNNPATTDDPNSPPQISLNASAGMSTPKTFRMYGFIRHHRVVILIDYNSTHNFI